MTTVAAKLLVHPLMLKTHIGGARKDAAPTSLLLAFHNLSCSCVRGSISLHTANFSVPGQSGLVINLRVAELAALDTK